MTERDELAKVIVTVYGEDAEKECPCEQDLDVADAILAAGYRKPPVIENEKLSINDGMLLLEMGSCTCTPYGSSHEAFCGYEYLDDLTSPLARSGYVKTRTITTAKELDALTVQSVILEAAGYSWQKMDSGNWVSWLNPGENSTWMVTGRRGPFVLIHEPQP